MKPDTLSRAIALLLGGSLTCLPAAHAEVSSVQSRWDSWQQHQQLEQTSEFAGLPWRAIGPVVQGGRILDIEQVPGKPYSFYVAYASGGVWRTDNNGVSFRPLSDGQPNMITGDLGVDPNRPEVLWVGSGEPNSSRSSYAGLGMFRSDDGGASFKPAGLAEVDRIARVVVNPKDGKHVCVAATGRLYTPGGPRGVWCSFDDGQNWLHTLDPKDDWTGAIDLVFAPNDPQTLYAATWERSRRPWNFVESGNGSGVWRSQDGGRNWTRLKQFPSGAGIGRIGLAVTPAAPDMIYASIDRQEPLDAEGLRQLGDRALSPQRLKSMDKDEFLRQDPDEIELLLRGSDLPRELTASELIELVRKDELTMDGLRERLRDGNAALFDVENRGIEIWRSTDAGASWAKTHDEILREVYYSYGYYFGQIRVAPDDPQRLYMLGVPVITSADGGKTFTGMNDPEVHVDHHAWWIDPQYPQRMLNGNDGGIDASYDGGQTWLKMDRQPVAQSYAVQFDFAEPYNVYTGLQDNGTLKGSSKARPDDVDAWTSIGGGDGMQIQVDPRDNVVYAGYQFGFYRRSDGQPVRPIAPLKDKPYRFNWQTPILLSPHSPEVLYMGAERLFRSTDRGQNFTPISPDLSKSKERGDVPFATISSISESALSFGLLWAGTDDGQIHVSRDGGVQWQEVGARLPDLWVSRIVASAHATERAYLSLNGYREDDMRALVWSTEDLGKTWTSIADGLPDEPVNVIVEDPVNAKVLYVGTDRGIYVSLDRGASWQALDAGLPNVPVHDLKVHPRDRELIAGTHGRGVWILDVLAVQQLDAGIRAKAVHLFAPAELEFQRGWKSAPDRWFQAEPDSLPKLHLSWWSASDGPVQLTLKDEAGLAVSKPLELSAKRGLNRIEWSPLLDQQLALAAEAERVKKADRDAESRKADDQAKPAKKPEFTLARTPIAQAIELGHPLYAPAGSYTLVLTRGDSSSEASLTIKPAKAFEPRVKEKWKLREK